MSTQVHRSDDAEQAPPPDEFFFDGYELDLRARELRSADGTRLPIETKALDLLALLIAERDRAIDKQELLDRVWRGRVVTEGSLTQAVFKLRRLLGETDAASSRIRTVHGHGLQWVGPVSTCRPCDPRPAPPRNIAPRRARTASPARRWIVLAGLLPAMAIALALVPNRAKRLTLAIAPIRLERPDQKLAWVPAGVQGLLIGLLTDDKIVAERAAPGEAPPTQPAAAVEQTPLPNGADYLLSAVLTPKGPLYELQLRLQTGADPDPWTDTLVGEQPAALAVDAASRVRKLPAFETQAHADLLKNAPPYIAETYARGTAEMQAGRMRAAIDYFRICVDHAPRQLWPQVKLADALRQAGRAAEGRAIALRIEPLTAAAGDSALHNEVLRTLARQDLQLNDLPAAQTHFQAALAGAETSGWQEARWQSLQGLALLARARGQFELAQQQLQALIADIEAAGGNRALLAETYNALGAVYSDGGELDQATATTLHALDLYRQIDQRNGELLAERNVATQLGMRWRALDSLPLALHVRASAQQLHDDHLLIWADTSIADSLAQLHAYAAARAYAEDAVALANGASVSAAQESQPNGVDRAQALFMLGFIDAKARRHDEAAAVLDQAAVLNTQAGSVIWASWSLAQASINAQARGRRADAENYSRQLFALADRAENLPLAPDSRHALRAVAVMSRADLRATAADFSGAAPDFDAALKLTDNIRYQQFIRLQWAQRMLARGVSGDVADLLNKLAPWRAQSADVRQLEIDFARLEHRPTADLEAERDRLLAAPILAEAIAAAPKSALAMNY